MPFEAQIGPSIHIVFALLEVEVELILKLVLSSLELLIEIKLRICNSLEEFSRVSLSWSIDGLVY